MSVSPEMIEAGIKAFLQFDAQEDSAQEIVLAVYGAMQDVIAPIKFQSFSPHSPWGEGKRRPSK